MKCGKCGVRMVLIDCCTFACPNCDQFLIDKRKAAKKLRDLEAELETFRKTRDKEIEEVVR